MVQVRNVHVDLSPTGDWLGKLQQAGYREQLTSLDQELARQLAGDDGAIAQLKGREMVEILSALNLDITALKAALCLPFYEQGAISQDWLENVSGKDLASLVRTVQQMQSISELQYFRRGRPGDAQIDTVRRMLLAMVEDVRAVLIKLAERICQLRLVKKGDEEERVLAAKECSEIYAPLANRLGVGQLKWELEDLAFRYLHPDLYMTIARQLDEKRWQREAYIADFVTTLQQSLDTHGVKAQVYGRPKHIYSIWRKMQKKNLQFDELFDIRAVRIITHSLTDCYGALGVVHSLWRHLPAEFDDYVATPKPNGYQSIHTVVIGPEHKNVEIQIRSEQMHDDAELGVAAHWMYKEGQPTGKAQGYEEKIAWLRKLLAWHEDMAGNEELVQEIRSQVFEDRVYVFTPQGDVMDLPAGATPLDFAYYVHSQVGHCCIGAKVDGRIVPFTYRLQNGERVEILTQKEPNPKRDWLNPALGYLHSARARSKVQTWFRKQDREHNLHTGREQLEHELAQHNLTLADARKAVAKFNVQQLDDLCVAIGTGDVRLQQVINYLKPASERPEIQLERLQKQRPEPRGQRDGVTVGGIGNLMMHYAKCCQPLPGDPITGYITQGRGVSVHHAQCDQVQKLLEQNPARGIDVNWESKQDASFEAALRVDAMDRPGLLHAVTSVLSHEKINVVNVSSQTRRAEQQVRIELTVLVRHQRDISRLRQRLQQVSDVLRVERV